MSSLPVAVVAEAPDAGLIGRLAPLVPDGLVELPLWWVVAGLVLLIGGVGSLVGWSLALQARCRRLEHRLARQREQARAAHASAEQAREVAEAALQARTQFFSAASHDLRQPLHALVLFADALRERCRDPDVLHLTGGITDAVRALDGLFDELLDLTWIDHGGVELHPQSFPFERVFERLRPHHEPVAFDKGLVFELRGGRHWLQADEQVLERILRNLVANAIRYTEDGGVLVTCRPRRGQFLIQVWDTGVGIAPQAQERIFDEFYQVSGEHRLASPHRKGLGLGLAIVKRLAGLMQADLQLCSRPGQGSVFSLTVPAGRPQEAPSPPPAQVRQQAMLTSTSLVDRCLVVVEDDEAVRAGLTLLLTGWGADVIGFPDLASVQAWVSQPCVRCPDLLIVDHGLPQQVTAPQVIRLLRERFQPDLPAIVITGEVPRPDGGGAAPAGHHLLRKPVAPNKLRAMIAAKLPRRPPEPARAGA